MSERVVGLHRPFSEFFLQELGQRSKIKTERAWGRG